MSPSPLVDRQDVTLPFSRQTDSFASIICSIIILISKSSIIPILQVHRTLGSQGIIVPTFIAIGSAGRTPDHGVDSGKETDRQPETSSLFLTRFCWTRVALLANQPNALVIKWNSLNARQYRCYRPQMWRLLKPNALVTKWNSLNACKDRCYRPQMWRLLKPNALVIKWNSLNACK